VSSLLVVCEGNVCRSPIAEALIAHVLPGWTVRSAGLNALIGAPADEIAIALMRERRIDLTRHRARQITRKMCLDAEMVLVMDSDQRRRLQDIYPEACGRIFRIGEYLDRDIADPVGRTEPFFRQVLSLIDQGTAQWVQRIHKL
jgi:protein-tyrosine phosphatase